MTARAEPPGSPLPPARPPPSPVPTGLHPPPRHEARGAWPLHHMPAVVPHIPGVHHIPFPMAGLPHEPLRWRPRGACFQPGLRQGRHTGRLSKRRTSRKHHAHNDKPQKAVHAVQHARRESGVGIDADWRQPALAGLSSSGLAVSATKARPRRRWREIAKPSRPAPKMAIVPGSGTLQIRL